MKSIQPDSLDVRGTIQKTLMTGLLFDGFWDRWIAHGLDRRTVTYYRRRIKTLDDWVEILRDSAREYERQAGNYHDQGVTHDAEKFYRIAGLHYQLIQWIFPETCDEKRKWFTRSKELFRRADAISTDKILESIINIDGQECFGRIRVPEISKGCVIIVNPIDSAKEELYTYEMDFSKKGFATVSFDGPGQGETYVFNHVRANRKRWELFIDKVIGFAAECFPELSIHLFGTSSGAAWALSGSCHPKVTKVVAVSPACENDVKLPDYFMERLTYILDNMTGSLIPNLEDCDHYGPVFLFHGKEDVMVKNEDIYRIYERLPRGKRLVEYEGEGHCCNYKLAEVRQISTDWFLEEEA